MAKPKPLTDLDSTATSPPCYSNSLRRTSRHHKPSSSKRQSYSPYSGPSSSLLALLATVAASSSSVDGRPLAADSQPPDFLCPLLPIDISEDPSLSPSKRSFRGDEVDEDYFILKPTPTRARRAIKRRALVADKYIQGDDGQWRKEHSWTLYGSTYCECTDTATSAVQQVDDQVQPTQIVSTTPASSAISSSTDMTGSLPSGWYNNHPPQKDVLTPIILTLSLLLAIFICVLIFGCVVWRRKRRVAEQKDVEKKCRKYLDDELDETEEVKRMRSQQRMWAKATARWKAGVRQSARRRRKQPSTASMRETDTQSSVSLPSQHSFAVSRRPSSISHWTLPPDTTSIPTATDSIPACGETPHTHETDVATDGSLDGSRPSQPPEYPVDGTSEARLTRLDSAIGRSLASEDGTPAVTISKSASTSREIHCIPANAAHVATDDKTVLARMANLASSPPPEELPLHGNPDQSDTINAAGPLVPVLDEFEELPLEIQVVDEDGTSGSNSEWCGAASNALLSPSANLPVPTYSREPSPQPPIFPAPPSKAQLAAPDFLQYPSFFEEDLTGFEPNTLPPAPAFEAPSAPPLDDTLDEDAVPCAPPLIDEEEEIQLGFTHVHAPSSSSAIISGRDRIPSSSTDFPESPSRGRTSVPFSRRSANPPDYLP